MDVPDVTRVSALPAARAVDSLDPQGAASTSSLNPEDLSSANTGELIAMAAKGDRGAILELQKRNASQAARLPPAAAETASARPLATPAAPTVAKPPATETASGTPLATPAAPTTEKPPATQVVDVPVRAEQTPVPTAAETFPSKDLSSSTPDELVAMAARGDRHAIIELQKANALSALPAFAVQASSATPLVTPTPPVNAPQATDAPASQDRTPFAAQLDTQAAPTLETPPASVAPGVPASADPILTAATLDAETISAFEKADAVEAEAAKKLASADPTVSVAPEEAVGNIVDKFA